MAFKAAPRRAVALIDGLLSVGRNRKKPSQICFVRTRWGLPDLAGEPLLMIRRLIVPLTVAVVTLHAGHVFAQNSVSGATAQPERRARECFAVSAGDGLLLRRFRRRFPAARSSIAEPRQRVECRKPAVRRRRAARQTPA